MLRHLSQKKRIFEDLEDRKCVNSNNMRAGKCPLGLTTWRALLTLLYWSHIGVSRNVCGKWGNVEGECRRALSCSREAG